jgi:predicted naringenin-chalcone synthase
MTVAHINRIGSATPPNDIHGPFIAFARTLLPTERSRQIFDRMADRAGIDHRFSVLRAGNLAAGEVDAAGFYRRGAFPSTKARMELYETESLTLALAAVAAITPAPDLSAITHLVVASCTGFSAPGLDLLLANHLELRRDLQRVMVGFMGCSAAIPALRTARDIVLADRAARVLVVNLELCSLHLQESPDIEEVLSFLLFGDGATAALVTAQPGGIALGEFSTLLIPDSRDLITWHIGDQGFRMYLSGKVPGRIAQALRAHEALFRPGAVDLWAVHAGGRTVLDAVEIALRLAPEALRPARSILRDFGNMSSATIMFLLQRWLQTGSTGNGVALAFGPGMVAESFRFAIP